MPEAGGHTIIRRIEERLAAMGLSAEAASKQAGMGRDGIRDLKRSKTGIPQGDHLVALAHVLDVTPEWLLGEGHPESLKSREIAPQSLLPLGYRFDEMDIRVSAGPGTLVDEETKIAEWEMPRGIVRAVTSALPQHLKVITVIGDSMEPTFRPGDKVLVDTQDRTPTPPGIFVVWDGLGLVLKRVQHLVNSDPPTVRISSDNDKYDPYQVVLEGAYIQGRVLGKCFIPT